MNLLFLGIFAGLVIPFQTAINSRLRSYVLSPFLASLISFLVGTLFLMILTLSVQNHILLTVKQLHTISWWMYLGGFLGMIGLTINILLFPILGSVQTVIMPILGQIITSMVIDNFGLFGTKQHALSLMRFIGVMLLIGGVLIVVALPEYLAKNQIEKQLQDPQKFKWVWQIIGVGVGGILAIQAAVNGRLGSALQSPVQAALISFGIGTLLLLIVTILQGSLKNVQLVLKAKTPWWIWIGGFLGAIYIFMNAFLVPKLGTGMVVVLLLLGQIISSLNIDQFGLLGSVKSRISLIKICGLIIMIGGVGLIEMM